jgi:hypothetical protein
MVILQDAGCPREGRGDPLGQKRPQNAWSFFTPFRFFMQQPPASREAFLTGFLPALSAVFLPLPSSIRRTVRMEELLLRRRVGAAFGEIDYLITPLAYMFFIKLVGKDFRFLSTVRAFAHE